MPNIMPGLAAGLAMVLIAYLGSRDRYREISFKQFVLEYLTSGKVS